MNRRSFIILLIGAIASLGGFGTTAYLRQSRCEELGGRWPAATRRCELSTGEPVSSGRASDLAAGAFVAIVLGFMLFRATTFAASRMSRPPPSQT